MSEVSKRTRQLGIAFLTLAALTLVLGILTYDRGTLMMEHYISPMIFVFAGLTLFSGRYGKRLDYWLGMAFVAWYVISRILMKELYLDYSYSFFANLSCVYLLAFPFALTMNDVGRKQGLKAVAASLAVCCGLMAWLAVLCALLGVLIKLPWFGAEFGIKATPIMRLVAGPHPNLCAALFLIALMLGIWLAVQLRRRWFTAVMALLSVGLYTGIALTVSRTVMLQVCCFAAGLVFVGALKMKIPALWKRLVIGIALAVVCAVLVFFSFGWITDGVSGLSAAMQAQAETVQEAAPMVAERSLLKDLSTMTGRTHIYKQIFELLKDRPSIYVTGLRNSEIVQVLRRYTNADSAHSSYLQTLLNMGLPALLIAIWFTLRAVWVSLRLIFSRKAAFGDQIIAVAILTLLVSTITESLLFSESITACNMPFFLLLGYAIESERALRA